MLGCVTKETRHRLDLVFSRAFCLRKAALRLMLKSKPPSHLGEGPGEEGCCPRSWCGRGNPVHDWEQANISLGVADLDWEPALNVQYSQWRSSLPLQEV